MRQVASRLDLLSGDVILLSKSHRCTPTQCVDNGKEITVFLRTQIEVLWHFYQMGLKGVLLKT